MPSVVLSYNWKPSPDAGTTFLDCPTSITVSQINFYFLFWCVHISVCAGVHACMCTCVWKLDIILRCHFSEAIFSETGSPTGVGFTYSARPVAQQIPNILLSPPAQHWDYKHLSSPEPPSPWYSKTSIKTTLKDFADITWQRNNKNKVIEIKI